MKQLAPIDIVAPANLGLDLEAKGKILSPMFATKASNFVIDGSGTLSARKGWTDQTTTEIGSTPNIETMHEYIDGAGNTEIILAWDGGIANDIDNPAGNDVSGALTDTNGTWKFCNFNDKCIGFQAGQKLAVYAGSTFATVTESSGTAPTGGVGNAVFGRIWQVGADGSTLYYSGLLDEADWGSASAGSIDFNNIWIDGQDRITAVVGFNGSLVVFGVRHIVFIVDGSGSALGLTPTAAYVADVISGTGCVDQHTVQAVGETELYFLSANGVQSLGRLIQEKSNPTKTISKKVRSQLVLDYRSATAGTIRSVYSPDNGFYLLTFGGTKTYCFDTRRPYQDEVGDYVVPAFTWTLAPYSWVQRENGTLLMGQAGNVGKYDGYTDNGANIFLEYESPWLDLGEELGNRLKILKRIGAIILTGLSGDITYKWAVDFETTWNSRAVTLSASSASSEWGVAEWGVAEWSGAVGIRILKLPARDTGQYYKIGITADIDTSFTMQQLELFAKIGRLA